MTFNPRRLFKSRNFRELCCLMVAIALQSPFYFLLRQSSPPRIDTEDVVVVRMLQPSELAAISGSSGRRNEGYVSASSRKALVRRLFNVGNILPTRSPEETVQESNPKDFGPLAAGSGYEAISTVEIIEGLKSPWALRIAKQLESTLSFSHDLYELNASGISTISARFSENGDYLKNSVRGSGSERFVLTYSLKTFFELFSEMASEDVKVERLKFRITYRAVTRESDLDKPMAFVGTRFYIEKSRVEHQVRFASAQLLLPGASGGDGKSQGGLFGLKWNFAFDKYFDRDIRKADRAPDPIHLLRKTLLALFEVYSDRGIIN